VIDIEAVQRMERFSNPAIGLRRAEAEDAPAIAELYCRAMAEEEGIKIDAVIIERTLRAMMGWLEDPARTIVVAELGGEIIAECIYHIWARPITGETVCELAGIYTLPAYRRSGVTVTLLARVIEIARELQVDQFEFQQEPGVRSSFCERAGAKPVSTWYRIQMR